jgi:hypothetical protein
MCPWLSQSSQNRSNGALAGLDIGTSSFRRSQLKMSCPGLSHISHTSCCDPSEFVVLVDVALRGWVSNNSLLFFDDFLWRCNLSFVFSSSCSSSSLRNVYQQQQTGYQVTGFLPHGKSFSTNQHHRSVTQTVCNSHLSLYQSFKLTDFFIQLLKLESAFILE